MSPTIQPWNNDTKISEKPRGDFRSSFFDEVPFSLLKTVVGSSLPQPLLLPYIQNRLGVGIHRAAIKYGKRATLKCPEKTFSATSYAADIRRYNSEIERCNRFKSTRRSLTTGSLSNIILSRPDLLKESIPAIAIAPLLDDKLSPYLNTLKDVWKDNPDLGQRRTRSKPTKFPLVGGEHPCSNKRSARSLPRKYQSKRTSSEKKGDLKSKQSVTLEKLKCSNSSVESESPSPPKSPEEEREGLMWSMEDSFLNNLAHPDSPHIPESYTGSIQPVNPSHPPKKSSNVIPRPPGCSKLESASVNKPPVGMEPGKLYSNSSGTKRLRASKSSQSNVPTSVMIDVQQDSQNQSPKPIQNLKIMSQRKEVEKEIKNFDEWNRFCLLKKHRHDSVKLKEQMDELEKMDKLSKDSVGKLWRQAEIFKHKMEEERAQVAEFCGITLPPEEETSEQEQSVQLKSKDEHSNTSKQRPKATRAPLKSKSKSGISSLVLPPRMPHLSFLVPDVSTGAIKIRPLIINKAPLQPLALKPMIGSGETTLPSVEHNRKEGNFMASSITGNKTKLAVGSTRKIISPPSGLANSGILEVVSSFIPAEASRTKLMKSKFTMRNEGRYISAMRLSPVEK